ncbi:MAG: glucosaminidase domain-containing protein [Crocinitomicaceae bacterium]
MKFLVLTFVLSMSTLALTETKLTTVQYIDLWKNTAVEQMHAHKIPASITLAQGILESGSGNSRLAKEAKNHFGIKCHKTWSGDTFIQDDDTRDECFRSYYSAAESYTDHSLFLSRRGRYSNLFLLDLDNYKGWATGLKSAGYATNPKYAYLLIDLIERYHLNQYDKVTSDKISVLKKQSKSAEYKAVVKKSSNSDPQVGSKTKEYSKTKMAPVASSNYNNNVSVVEIKHNAHEVTTSLNKVKYILVHEGDTFYRLAKEFDITITQLYRYNEFKNKDVLEIGDRIYVSPKKSKGPRGKSNYVCKKTISLREIAHEQGIKLNSIMKLNLSENPDEVLRKGSKVTLR